MQCTVPRFDGVVMEKGIITLELNSTGRFKDSSTSTFHSPATSLSALTNHLSNIVTCPNFTERGAWNRPISKGSTTDTGIGSMEPSRSLTAAATAGNSRYRMDDSFKLAFLFDENH